ncbi:hypothetical protein CYMTET_53303 [Cymbomonas tetramitiformis]|uniref:Glucose-6-phosphate 1-dehydrogenase n=1 Tax=Cymbomonas tetramitiformis TaxID=36881 RepID=A0AAE0BJ16_9CHLO|nr:hypothetical protein CYMTET_53303 [Cymbomonas tetramitiformis]
MSNMSDAGKDASSSASTCVSIAVLGASGDLAKKKTYPALFKLFEKSFLPKDVIIIGYARSAMTNESLRDQLRGYLKGKKEEVDAFLQLCIYVAGQYKLSPAEEGAPPKDFQVLANTIAEFEATFPGDCGKNRLFYLALPPVVYPPVCEGIKKCCMSPYGWSRVVVEKPFGKDLASSEDLNEQICGLFDEKQLYRIDHYLGKEIVQNLMVMRFANTFISPLWNRDNISNIQIIFKEPFGTEGRGGYFDQYGIIRDVIQNHLLQVMALVAMERPATLSPNDMRDEKLKVLKCISPLSTENTVLGQYTMGKNGQPGYLEDDTVPPGSKCPTFAMVVLYVQNERWDGVPFILKPWHLPSAVALAASCGTCRLPWHLPSAVALAASRGTCRLPWLLLPAVAHAVCRGSCCQPWHLPSAAALAASRGTSRLPWHLLPAVALDVCRGTCCQLWLLPSAVALLCSRGTCHLPWLLPAISTAVSAWLLMPAVALAVCRGSCCQPWLLLPAVALAICRGSCVCRGSLLPAGTAVCRGFCCQLWHFKS